MFQEVSLCIWMLRAKYDIIILAKAIGEKPMERQMMKPLQGKTCEGFSIARKCWSKEVAEVRCNAQKTIEALQVSRLPKPDGWTVLPGAPKESG